MRKRFVSLLLVVCMIVTLFPAAAFGDTSAADPSAASATSQAATQVPVGNPFTDVKDSDWYFDAVQYARVNGFFNGTSATTFDPNGTMTRGMFVTVLGRMAGVDAEDYKGESVFRDVPAGAYYAPYVAWASQYGITSGTSSTTFSPDDLITRQQMAAFFVRYFEAFDVDYETGADITTTPKDMDSVADYAKDAVLKLWKQGLLNGDGKKFDPQSNASRAQTATLCMRADDAVDTWYKAPGVKSDRVSVDPVTGEAVKPGEDREENKPSNEPSYDYSDGTTSTTYYEVQFAMGTGQSVDGVTLPETKTYAKDTKITLLPTPYQENGVFLGWYYDAAMTNAVGNDDVIGKNMTLYAKMGQVTPVSEDATPNYITVTVPVSDVDSYTFGISGYTEGCVESFIHVSNLNRSMDFTVSGTTVRADYEEGQTYSVKLKDDSSAVFVVNGEPQSASIRVLNIITEKGEVQNLTLDGDVKYLPAASVSNMTGTALDGLFTVSTTTQSMTQNKNEGTFTYEGNGIAAGDTVAIYEGTRPDLRSAVGASVTNNEGSVAYVKITSVNGHVYSYETADTEEVLFTPDVLPIPVSADTDGSADNNSITVAADVLDFTDDKYAAMGLDSQTVVEQGDFIALYNGAWGGAEGAPTYGQITSVTLQADGTYVIAYT
ncbi:MAG: S-layer homology domain-containing protein, partial [Firmicutes bacterium]|nr:S-layer homology domain-containing protein [Bacillota bacterium]